MKILVLLISLLFTFQASAQVPSGAKAFYPFNGNTNDSSGNQFHGTDYNLTQTSDRFGNQNSAYKFNGTSSFVNLGASVGDSIRTLSLWFKLDEIITTSLGSPRSLMVRNKTGAGGITLIFNPYVEYTPGACHFGRNIGSSPNIIESQNTTWDTANWHHVVVTIDSISGMQMYIDNVLQSDTNSSTASTDFSTDDLAIGAWSSSLRRYFKGDIDDVRIYERGLDNTEVSNLYNESNPTLSITEAINRSIDLNIFPNPAYKSLTIDTRKLADASTVKMINNIGQVVLQNNISMGYNNLELEGLMNSGIYLIQVYDKNETLIAYKKVMLQQ
jgi:hypothetical protein